MYGAVWACSSKSRRRPTSRGSTGVSIASRTAKAKKKKLPEKPTPGAVPTPTGGSGAFGSGAGAAGEEANGDRLVSVVAVSNGDVSGLVTSAARSISARIAAASDGRTGAAD
jgi:hypothetical protein